MTIVHKVDGVWQAAHGVLTLKRMVATRVVHYHDGRREEEACDPYPVDDVLDAGKVEQLVAEGVWGDEELAAYGLKVAAPFAVPEGKQRIGEASYIESKGTVREVYEVEDIPPPPPEPTAEEKLASLGLTRAELRALVADEAKR